MTTKDEAAREPESTRNIKTDKDTRSTKDAKSTRDDGLPEPTEADLNFGKADPSDPSLNSYDIDYQAAPARGDLNTTEEQGEPVNPEGFPEDIAEVQRARQERTAKNVKENRNTRDRLRNT